MFNSDRQFYHDNDCTYKRTCIISTYKHISPRLVSFFGRHEYSKLQVRYPMSTVSITGHNVNFITIDICYKWCPRHNRLYLVIAFSFLKIICDLHTSTMSREAYERLFSERVSLLKLCIIRRERGLRPPRV